MFQGKEILLATMHQKEVAIQNEIELNLGCKLIVPKDFDTDRFGTFCGEKKRSMTAREMVRHKAKVASKEYGYSLCIATEGSFGAHPIIPLMPHHEELMIFFDSVNNIEIIVNKNTDQTNYGYAEFEKDENFDYFLFTHSFPSHALMVRAMSTNQVLAKGIQTMDELKSTMKRAFMISPRIRLETDMRAMFNPTRMQVIKELTSDLINRIQSVCSNCGAYGFGDLEIAGHLPCSDCGFSTRLYQNIIQKCIRCNYQITKPRPDMLYLAEPTYCNICNP